MSVTEDEVSKCLMEAKDLKKKLPSSENVKKTSERMKLLANPTRLMILKILSEKSVCVCVLVELVGKSQPNISQHLAKLKDNRIIEDYPVGKLVFYMIIDKSMKTLVGKL